MFQCCFPSFFTAIVGATFSYAAQEMRAANVKTFLEQRFEVFQETLNRDGRHVRCTKSLGNAISRGIRTV